MFKFFKWLFKEKEFKPLPKKKLHIDVIQELKEQLKITQEEIDKKSKQELVEKEKIHTEKYQVIVYSENQIYEGDIFKDIVKINYPYFNSYINDYIFYKYTTPEDREIEQLKRQIEECLYYNIYIYLAEDQVKKHVETICNSSGYLHQKSGTFIPIHKIDKITYRKLNAEE